jgi:signal transduction histidine kinase
MSIVNNDIFMRYVMMIKDVTKTYQIIQELNENQEIMANREKFATLGQLISGIVHSLKSPIFSITGNIAELNSLIEEYVESVGDPSVTVEDHYEIAKDMNDSVARMKEQVENISDSITAVRSQVITLNNDDEASTFTIEELIKYIDILTKNTLKQYLIVLNFIVRVRKNIEISGNLNALVQVVNNLIMNSIESYEGKPNQIIDVVVDKVNNNLEISVIDTGIGIPEKIQQKIFKEIIANDKNDKAGLGLFMSYSNIKVQFDGDIVFTSVEGKGSTFKIILPIK